MKDPLIPHIVWRNLQPLLNDNSLPTTAILAYALETEEGRELLPLVVDRLLARKNPIIDPISETVRFLTKPTGPRPRRWRRRAGSWRSWPRRSATARSRASGGRT